MRTQRHAQWLPRSVAAAAVLLLAALLTAPAGLALAADNTAWDDIRAQLYGSEREIASGDGVIALEAPYRALDAATVPEIGRAHVRTPVTNAHLGCCILREKQTSTQ